MPRRFYFWISSFFVAILLAPCQQSIAQTAANVTQLKLENFGWQPHPPIVVREAWSGHSGPLVSIDHKGRVLVGFTVRGNPGLATREHPPLSFHILRFTPEGKVDLSLALPTISWFTNGFYLGPNDQIFARANDVLQEMLEEDGTRKEGTAWRFVASCPKTCGIGQSRNRRFLSVSVFIEHNSWGLSNDTILDASSSPPHVVQNCPRAIAWVSDKFAYTVGKDHSLRRSPVCEPEQSVELPVDIEGASVHVLNDGLFLLLGIGVMRGFAPRRGIELVTPDGQVKFRQEMPKQDMVMEEAKIDERGDRFAFIVDTWRGGSRFLDIGGKRVARRIVVYTDTGQQLATVPVNPAHEPEAGPDFDFSMSPDGHRLAIVDADTVTIVDLK